MVRENKQLSKTVTKSKGFDQDEGVTLSEELEGTPNDMRDHTYHETVEETEIRGDAVPDKKG